jgi:uncharacterized protein YjaZ
MTTVETIDALAGLRQALAAPADRQAEIFRERVMEPLRAFWEPTLARMPPPPDGGTGDRALDAARAFGYYRPELGAAEGLRALDRLAGAGAACRRAVEGACQALAPEEHGVALERVLFTLVLGDPARFAPSEHNPGYTGFGGQPGTALVICWPDDYNLPRLPAAAAHEVHHNVRLSFEPWTPATTVGQYVVLEGLAEAFAAELCGADLLGPWATALDEEGLAVARPRIREALDVSGFDEIRGYIFGDWAAASFGYAPKGLPDFAGYAVGYRIVDAYLRRTRRTAAVATYVPWREIVEESGYL